MKLSAGGALREDKQLDGSYCYCRTVHLQLKWTRKNMNLKRDY